MGNIRQTYVKRVAVELVKKHADVFTTDFEQNKKLVDQYAEVSSKNLRNRIAGYVTRYRNGYEEATINQLGSE
ncbi:MAG: 30S ribosomal protein S17e [Thermoplasmata archaeon HGW-Thermoplasmata-1]|nr:MAG: 30S ribosomal protein S17e [Thermoplasmata archaeon HGW-Thermoplasmata-1]